MRRFLLLLACFACMSAASSAHAKAADVCTLPSGVAKGIKVERLTTDARQGVNWVAKGIRRTSKGDVLAEVFRVTDPKTVAAIRKIRSKGIRVRGNADPEFISFGVQPKLSAEGVELRPWGGNGLREDGSYDAELNPRKVHAKVVHYGKKSWVSTSPLIPRAEDTFDVSVITSGEAAAAARQITERAYDDDIPGLVEAAEKGKEHGVLVNNATAGITHLTDAMEEVIGGARTELIVAFKMMESPRFARLINEAVKRGVKVTLITPHVRMSAKVRAMLKKRVKAVEPQMVLHGNVIMADRKVAIFGSAHATDRALGRGSKRESHEMGFVIDDTNAVDYLYRRLVELAGK